MPKPLAIIQMGEPPAAIFQAVGEQSRWFVEALSLAPTDHRVFRPDLHDHLPAIEAISGAIITGSWAMVTEQRAWSEETAKWIRQAYALQLPLLGVCYGHQLIAHALGGVVGDNPRGSEYGLQLVQLSESGSDPLLMPLPVRFSAWLSHQQTVLRPPEGATVLACSAQDDCQIIRYSETAYSVQFHPEFTWDVMVAYLKYNKLCLDVADFPKEPFWPRLILNRFYYLWCHPQTEGVIL